MGMLAQTFIVIDTDQSNANQSGVYLTSVDIYFQSKDDTYPVYVEIGNTKNGLQLSNLE